MIKFLIILLMFGCTAFITILIFKYSIKSKKNKKKQGTNKIPKLSSLKGKEFSKYIDDLTKDL